MGSCQAELGMLRSGKTKVVGCREELCLFEGAQTPPQSSCAPYGAPHLWILAHTGDEALSSKGSAQLEGHGQPGGQQLSPLSTPISHVEDIDGQ